MHGDLIMRGNAGTIQWRLFVAYATDVVQMGFEPLTILVVVIAAAVIYLLIWR